MPSPQKKYTTLVSNTLLFAISNFSSKLLSFFIRPYLSYALDSPDVMGVSSLLQQATNLLIPVVSLGVAYAVIRFGLDKATNKSSVFVNGAATIGLGFVVLLLAMPLVRLIPNAAEYLGFLYLCVLASCMRTLCTQFIRSRMLNRLVAIDGVLTTLSLLLYYLLFLSVLKMGAAGFLLANALADLTSMVFVFIAGGCWRYFKPKAFDKTLWKEMLRYCLPMIPASISFWIINASDMFFVQGMCEGYAGRSGNHWVGLLSAGYFLPQIITILGSIFYEAWQLSAVTEETDREAFFSKIFRVYASVLFCCVAGIIMLCQLLMRVFKAEYFDAWTFVPFLTLCSMLTCRCHVGRAAFIRMAAAELFAEDALLTRGKINRCGEVLPGIVNVHRAVDGIPPHRRAPGRVKGRKRVLHGGCFCGGLCSLRGRGGCLGGRACRHVLRRSRAGRQRQRQQTDGQPCGVFHRGYPPLFVVPPA